MPQMLYAAIVLFVLLTAVTPGVGKTAATYYTPERIATARENVESHEWAQKELQTILDGQRQTYIIGREYCSAEDYSQQTDDFMWELQPPTTIPRVFPHETYAECPVHGTEVRKINAFHPWLIDPINHPYQIQCRLGKEWYPSNDFEKGDMTSGEFPDDGSGYLAPDGRRYYFIREYVHQCYCAVTVPTLRSLSKAWLLTGEEKYAHKGCILLARLASEYPNFDDRKDRRYVAPYGGHHPHYKWKTGGMITDLIWETFCTEAAVMAYDAFYEYMDDDPELIKFLQSKGMPVENADDLREYIEDYILRPAAEGVLNGAIHGNEGFRQALAMSIALVLDDYSDTHPNSKDMVDYTYHGGGHTAYIMVNALRRDGSGHESCGYNQIKFDFIRVAQLMEQIRSLHPDRYPRDQYPDIFATDKARSLFDHFIDLQIQRAFMPSIGDSSKIRPPRRVEPRAYSAVGSENIYAFNRWGDPRYARACVRVNGDMYPGELFDPYPAEAITGALDDPAAEIPAESRLLSGYGVGILDSGDEENRITAALNYSALVGHRQEDNLAIGLWARGVNMLPDLGYPFTWDYRWDWDSNLMAHNTVSVGESHADRRVRVGNGCSLFASEDGVHVVTAHHHPYPEGFGHTKDAAPDVDLYERTLVMVDVADGRSYLVDLFNVRGGDQHDQSWHGPLTEPQAPDLDWQVQETGTLAGPDVEQFEEYTDRWGRTGTNFPCYVKDVRRAELSESATWTWEYGLEEGDRLNLHILPVGGPLEAIMCSGRSPARPKDWKLDYIFARRMVQSRERSLFVTVLDAYQDEPVVKAAKVISEEPLQISVQLESGRDIITLAAPETSSRSTQHRDHGVRMVSERDGKTTRDVQIGQYAPEKGPGYLTGTINALDYPAREVAVEHSAEMETQLQPGRAVRIYNDHRSAMFRIEKVEVDDDVIRLTLDTSALLARGPVEAVEDGAMDIAEYFLYATGHAGEEGKLASTRHLFFAGSRLGEGDKARMLRGASRESSSQSRVYFAEPVTEAALAEDYAGEVVSVWQYGVGDQLEIACIQ
ncbi:MAG: heparinase II/III family protein [Armatimonadota bacterium]